MQFSDRIKHNVTPRHDASLIGGLCFVYVLVLRFESTSLRNFNWDEFNFLQCVYHRLRGQLPARLSFHSYLFFWLPSLWDHEVDEIIWGRRVLVLLQSSSWVALWLIGRKLLDSLSLLASLAALLSVTYCVMYGIEFRYDILITPLVIWSCAIDLLTRLTQPQKTSPA